MMWMSYIRQYDNIWSCQYIDIIARMACNVSDVFYSSNQNILTTNFNTSVSDEIAYYNHKNDKIAITVFTKLYTTFEISCWTDVKSNMHTYTYKKGLLLTKLVRFTSAPIVINQDAKLNKDSCLSAHKRAVFPSCSHVWERDNHR